MSRAHLRSAVRLFPRSGLLAPPRPSLSPGEVSISSPHQAGELGLKEEEKEEEEVGEGPLRGGGPETRGREAGQESDP